VVVTPVWQIVRGDQTITIGTETACGPVLQKLYNHVQGIQYGDLPDAHGWCLRVEE
jgi:branched-subunit amino acid aminotransferase/4-amino-4-deoxychorismate lyase